MRTFARPPPQRPMSTSTPPIFVRTNSPFVKTGSEFSGTTTSLQLAFARKSRSSWEWASSSGAFCAKPMPKLSMLLPKPRFWMSRWTAVERKLSAPCTLLTPSFSAAVVARWFLALMPWQML